MGTFPPYHHLSWAFFFWPSLFFSLFHSATPQVWTHSGSRALLQPKHLFPFSGEMLGFSLSRWGLNYLMTFVSVDRERKREKKKKHDYTRTSFISVHSRQKEKKTIQEQDVPSTQGFISPAPLHCHLFPFTIRNCIEFVFSIRKLNSSM